MQTLIILQARTKSNRLPAKALLPVAGYSSAVLAALRAGNSGGGVVVATSTDPSDDLLAETLRSHGIRVVRGAEDDVLARYVLAASDLSAESAVVRLTADNVLPDGSLVAELVTAFTDAGVEYLSLGFPGSGLPYGVASEVFRAATLRRANIAAISAFDREHVTQWIIRNCHTSTYRPRALGASNYNHLRCTIDDEDDYKRMCALFEQVSDPLKADWYDLVRKLSQLPNEPAFRIPYRIIAGCAHSELTLGTAQLGMTYGIMNRSGQPRRELAIQMVRQAIAHGVTSLDTARSYGDAESVLGCALTGAWRSRVEVITKMSPLVSLGEEAERATVRAEVDRSVRQSSEELRIEAIGTLLLHRAHHYRGWRGEAWQRLLELRAQGKIARLGVSVYHPDEAFELLRDPDVQHLQLPMNVLDWRWREKGIDRALTDRSDVIVHARSALLQGLLVASPESWPWLADWDVSTSIRKLQRLAAEFGREGVTDLCLAYVRSQTWIHSIVVGCETLAQLNENLKLFCLPRLSADQCRELERSVPRAPEALLNPSQWKFSHEQPSN